MAKLKIKHPRNVSKKLEEAAIENAMAQTTQPNPMSMAPQQPMPGMSQAPSPDMSQAAMPGMKEGGMSSVSDYIKDLIK